MSDDETIIRQNFATWIRASIEGRLDELLPLMAEDALFLLPGRQPMRGRNEFADAFLSGGTPARLECDGTILELAVSGDMAYTVVQLAVTIHPPGGGDAVRRSGPVLTVYRKQPDGRWVLSRDANLLTLEGKGALQARD